MKERLLQLVFILLLSNYLHGQDYVAFEKTIESTVIGNHLITDENGEECTLKHKSIIQILGRGYNEFKGKYYFKNNECEGFLHSSRFWKVDGFKEQDRKAANRIYEIRNAQALKAIKEDKENEEAELKAEKERKDLLKKECDFAVNEVDVFDKVKVIQTTSKQIADGLWIRLYAKGNRKEVFFSTIDIGCASPYEKDRSWVKVMLQNEDIITFYHLRELNCSGFELWGNISSSEINRLKKSPIKAIRLLGTKYQHTITEFDWPTFFIDQLKCYNLE